MAMSDNPVLAYGAWLAETPADWPEAAWEAAHRAFIDIVAATIAGAAEPVTRRGGRRGRPAEARREAGGLCVLHGAQHGARLHVAVRYDDQAAARRSRRQVRRARREPGAAWPRCRPRHTGWPHGHEPPDGRPR